MSPTSVHIPVMLNEVLEWLQPKPDHWYIDATFGRGGHTRELLKRGARVIAFDHDQEAVSYGQEQFAQAITDQQLIIIRESFTHLSSAVHALPTQYLISGILFDFGTSTDQLQSADRGFSFANESELDMRMDDRLGVKAKDLLALLSEKQLAQVFSDLGGEREATKIAKAIVKHRQAGQFITTTRELADLIGQVKKEPRGHLNPATKVFQALRIIVNDELNSIEHALPQAFTVLNHGRIVTIAFHEGEDRIAKNTFNSWEKQGKGQVLTAHPLQPSQEEISTNNKARSAKLRVFEKP